MILKPLRQGRFTNRQGRFTNRPYTVLLALALLVPASAFAQYGTAPKPSNAVNEKPGLLKSIGIDQKIGQQLPLDLVFRDEDGKDVRLGQFFGSRPVVLALAYYECPMLCTQVLNGMTGALKTLSFDAGTDFDVVVVSIDPKDNFRLAANKKTTYVNHYGRPRTAGGWHFLTGSEASIKPLADAIGFRYAYDSNIRQYAHGAAIYVATPKGIVARYLLGIDFAPRDLRLALVEASNNQLGSITDKVLLLCYHYDPSVGKYGVAILNAVRIGFVATVTGFLAFLFVSLRRERTHQQPADLTMRTSAASEPRARLRAEGASARSAEAFAEAETERARERVGESEGRSPSDTR